MEGIGTSFDSTWRDKNREQSFSERKQIKKKQAMN